MNVGMDSQTLSAICLPLKNALQHLICNLTTQIQCLLKKIHFSYQKEWEGSFVVVLVVFFFSSSTTKYDHMQTRGARQLGKLLLLMTRKRKMDNMIEWGVWYPDLSPDSHLKYDNFISGLFHKLSQREKHFLMCH